MNIIMYSTRILGNGRYCGSVEVVRSADNYVTYEKRDNFTSIDVEVLVHLVTCMCIKYYVLVKGSRKKSYFKLHKSCYKNSICTRSTNNTPAL